MGTKDQSDNSLIEELKVNQSLLDTLSDPNELYSISKDQAIQAGLNAQEVYELSCKQYGQQAMGNLSKEIANGLYDEILRIYPEEVRSDLKAGLVLIMSGSGDLGMEVIIKSYLRWAQKIAFEPIIDQAKIAKDKQSTSRKAANISNKDRHLVHAFIETEFKKEKYAPPISVRQAAMTITDLAQDYAKQNGCRPFSEDRAFDTVYRKMCAIRKQQQIK